MRPSKQRWGGPGPRGRMVATRTGALFVPEAPSRSPERTTAEARNLPAILTSHGERRIEGGSWVRRPYNPLGGQPEQGGAVMHEEAIPILGVGDAAVSSESTPTIGQSPWRRASRNGDTWPAGNGPPTVAAR